MHTNVVAALLLMLVALPGLQFIVPADAAEDPIERFYVRMAQAELRVSADLGVMLIGFVEPKAGEDGAAFEAPLVDAARLEACRLQPHLYQVRLDGDAHRFWRLDTAAGKAWTVDDGLFGLVGGKAKPQPWMQVTPDADGAGIIVSMRDLEFVYERKEKKISVLGGGRTLAGTEHFTLEMPAPRCFHIAPVAGWGGRRLEVDVGAQEVRLARGAFASEGIGETTWPLSLTLGYWLAGGAYATTLPSVPRLLDPAADATLDNGRQDSLDLVEREFTWTPVPGADTYQIRVENERAVDASIDERVKRPWYREEDRSGINLRYQQDWLWKVRAFRGEEALPWSEARPFRVERADTDPSDGSAPLPLRGPSNSSLAPKLVSPKHGAVLDNGREDRGEPLVWDFRWSRMKKTGEYEIAILRDTEYPVVRARTKSTTYRFESRDLRVFGIGRTRWHWRVRGIREGRPLPWSARSSFEIEPLDSDPSKDAPRPSAAARRLIPGLLAPKAGAILGNAARGKARKVTWTFRWSAVPKAKGYDLQLLWRGSPHRPRIVRTDKLSYRHEFTSVVRPAFRYGHAWRVRAILDGVPQPWSETRSYDVGPAR